MGTRNLTMVVLDKKTKIAQYGQWDGYPSGQGATILEFMRNVDMSRFKNSLSKVRFTTEQDEKEIQLFSESIGSKDGWMTSEQSDLFNKKYPYFSRNHGGEILNLVYESIDEEIVLTNSEAFAGDGLFCEYAYVVDLDKEVLEVYTGFGKEPLSEDERFYGIESGNKDYSPVRILKSYNLNELPDKNVFISELEELEKSDYESDEEE